jgi:hypothetical protein
MPSTIKSTMEFRVRLIDAMHAVDQLVAKDPDPMIGSIQRQLRFVEQWTRGGNRPQQDQIDKLNFGLMASRAVDDTDQKLANELYDLSSYLKFWPPPGGWPKSGGTP